jgi:hypothetical protein
VISTGLSDVAADADTLAAEDCADWLFEGVTAWLAHPANAAAMNKTLNTHSIILFTCLILFPPYSSLKCTTACSGYTLMTQYLNSTLPAAHLRGVP